MRRAWAVLKWWPDGSWGVALAFVLGFAGSAFAGLVLLDHDADFALPMAAAVAVGSGSGQLIRMLWPKRTNTSPPLANAAPPQRPD